MASKKQTIHIVGGGLAGSECALRLADLGYQVVLFEMRQGGNYTPAHKTKDFAELVCSNSFGSLAGTSAPGQLKWEAFQMRSQILETALEAKVPAGQALGIDRVLFASEMTRKLKSHRHIEIRTDVIRSLSEVPRPAVIATGPLTQEDLAKDLAAHFGDEFLYFYDAIAPIIDTDSINMMAAWKGDRWGKGTGDYINCPMDINQYRNFVKALQESRKVELKEFEKNTPYFESCLPVEVLAERGEQTLRFGPMSPKGLYDPHRLRRPYAVVQLRQDNKAGTSYNMVGFQTKMAYSEQTRVFRMIPGLEHAEFLKLGSIHRNLYINSPKRLSPTLASRKDPSLWFAGQITGVEGYFDSTCTGIMVAGFVDDAMNERPAHIPPRASAMGALLHAITLEEKENFQPTNINFGLFPMIPESIHKSQKREYQISRARDEFQTWLKTLGISVREETLPVIAQALLPGAAPEPSAGSFL
jgi:methylenetetrahydrofolate--tRNA-(uracil-5-)-methyltransferase